MSQTINQRLDADILDSTRPKPTMARYGIVAMLFFITSINYGDRATLAITGSFIANDLGLSPVMMGYVFSAFSWAYVIGQLPGGWLLDRFGSKKVYFFSIFFWSAFTLLQGFIGVFSGIWAVITLFSLRFVVGLAESPSFPGNSRIAAAWFPASERATAVSIFNSAQYFATVIFAPIMGWITHNMGWPSVFFFMGGLGIIGSLIWLKVIHNPKDHPRANQEEIDYIAAGGGLVDMDNKRAGAGADKGPGIQAIKQLLRSRMLMGVCLGQYCVNGLTYFFITWFPVYLIKGKGLEVLQAGFVAAVPALCGFIGGILGGVISDWLMRKTGSLTLARKTPIVAGMLMSMTILICNYVDSIPLVVLFMSLSFFGKGMGALGWAVLADTAPKEISGLAGGFFNTCGNLSGIITPIAIGYIVGVTGSFHGALIYVAVHAAGVIFSYLALVGKIERLELRA